MKLEEAIKKSEELLNAEFKSGGILRELEVELKSSSQVNVSEDERLSNEAWSELGHLVVGFEKSSN